MFHLKHSMEQVTPEQEAKNVKKAFLYLTPHKQTRQYGPRVMLPSLTTMIPLMQSDGTSDIPLIFELGLLLSDRRICEQGFPRREVH